MSQSFVGTSGGTKKWNAMYVGTSGGTKLVQVGWVGTASGNKQFFVYFKISAAPNPCSQTYSGPGGVVFMTTPNCVVSVVGGSGSFTYAWTWQSGIIPATVVISNPSASTVSWSANVPNMTNYTSVWRVTVTDTVSGRSLNTDVTVTLNHVT